MVVEIYECFGCIDILVNNVGIVLIVVWLEVIEEIWWYVLDVNLNGVFLCVLEVFLYMCW